MTGLSDQSQATLLFLAFILSGVGNGLAAILAAAGYNIIIVIVISICTNVSSAIIAFLKEIKGSQSTALQVSSSVVPNVPIQPLTMSDTEKNIALAYVVTAQAMLSNIQKQLAS